MWIGLSEWVKNMNIFVFKENVHQSVTSAGEDFNSQEDKMMHSMDTSQPLSPATLSSPKELMDKVAMVAGIEVIHGLSHMDFHSPRLTWLQALLSAQPAR